jgi:predicted oxidoreductase
LLKIKHEQNDIIAYHCRHYELGVWDKTNIEGNAKHDSCLLRKQNTTFDHADIYGSPLKVLSAKHLLVNSREKIQLISNVGSKCWLKIEITKSNITTTLSHTLSGLLNNR